MTKPYQPYVPQTVGELWDKLGSMMLSSPRFEDDSGFFPGKGLETEFWALTECLKLLRPVLGDERYAQLSEMSRRMRAYFEADPEDKTDDSLAGRDMILKMEEILEEVDDPADRPGVSGTR